MSERTRHVVAFYEIDRRHGGPEEGGWWYDCGELHRVLRVAVSEEAAHAAAARANRLMDRLQRCMLRVSSLAYEGGRHKACLFAGTAPQWFPEGPAPLRVTLSPEAFGPRLQRGEGPSPRVVATPPERIPTMATTKQQPRVVHAKRLSPTHIRELEVYYDGGGMNEDVKIKGGELKITPLKAITRCTRPRTSACRLHGMVPAARITGVLAGVHRWTGFADAFVPLHSGLRGPRPARRAHRRSVPDAANLGLTRMADACSVAGCRKLAWTAGWHLREDDPPPGPGHDGLMPSSVNRSPPCSGLRRVQLGRPARPHRGTRPGASGSHNARHGREPRWRCSTPTSPRGSRPSTPGPSRRRARPPTPPVDCCTTRRI